MRVVAGAIGGFLMRSALPGEEVRIEERFVPPASVPLWLFWRLFDAPIAAPCVEKPPAVELKLLNNKPL